MTVVDETPKPRPQRMLAELLLARWDVNDAVVLADWCEEHELEPVAEALRGGPSEVSWKLLNALAACFDIINARVAFTPPAHPSWIAAALGPLAEPGWSSTQFSVLGFSEDDLSPAEVLILETLVAVPTRLMRIMFSPDCIDALVVEDIRVGRCSMISAGGGVPARILDGSDLTLPDFDLPTAGVGTAIRLVVRNIASRPVTVRASARVRELIA